MMFANNIEIGNNRCTSHTGRVMTHDPRRRAVSTACCGSVGGCLDPRLGGDLDVGVGSRSRLPDQTHRHPNLCSAATTVANQHRFGSGRSLQLLPA